MIYIRRREATESKGGRMHTHGQDLEESGSGGRNQWIFKYAVRNATKLRNVTCTLSYFRSELPTKPPSISGVFWCQHSAGEVCSTILKKRLECPKIRQLWHLQIGATTSAFSTLRSASRRAVGLRVLEGVSLPPPNTCRLFTEVTDCYSSFHWTKRAAGFYLKKKKLRTVRNSYKRIICALKLPCLAKIPPP